MIELGLLEKFPNSRLLQATPSRTVFSEGSLKVKIYNAFESPARAQVLLFPSLINRPYILDLGRGRSLIQALVKSGVEVVLFDWGSPGPEEKDLGLAALLENRIPAALTAVHAFSEFDEADPRPRTIMGHCLGGNLALLFAAAVKKRVSPLRLDRIVCLTTPIDTANHALINTWFQIPQWNPEKFARSFETIPWPLMQLSFLLLRPTVTPRRWIQFAGRFLERDYRDAWLQLEIWSNDNVSFPSELFKSLLIPMYRDNAMVSQTCAVFAINDLDLPIFSIASTDDHLVPISSSSAIRSAVPKSSHEFFEVGGGHIGAVLSKKSREKIWPSMIDFILRPAVTSSDSTKRAYRIDQELRANPFRKSAATDGEALTPVAAPDLLISAGNLGARRSSAPVQT